MNIIKPLSISYPDFILNTTIDPEQFDVNNLEIVTKINSIINEYNNLTATNIPITTVTDINASNLQSFIEALKAYVDNTDTTLRTLITILNTYVDTKDVELKANIDSIYATLLSVIDTHKLNTSNPHNVTASQLNVYTKTELDPYLRGGDTVIKYDVFTIVNGNNGNSTFTYSDASGNMHTGVLNAQGHQTFTLISGSYTVGQNRIECVINDTLSRSVASGGLFENSSNTITLTSPEGNGAEITFKYFEKIGIVGTGLIVINANQPPSGYVWYKVLT